MPTKIKPTISVFFPCYNDSKTIGDLVKNATAVLKEISSDFEVIVIDDGSTDKSREVLKKLVRTNKSLKLILHEKNQGYGGALKSGFKNSTKELVFYTDGDGQYDVLELPLLLPLLSDDVDFINGIKMQRGDSADRVFFGNLHKFITRWMFWLAISDTDCDFRLIRNKVLKKVLLKSNSGSICVELVKKCERAGARFREISVHHYPRKYGKSEFFKLDKIISTYIDLLGLWVKLMVFDRSAK
jgi:glycosyltransferase involved in cell wall biosynthesis